MILAWLLLLTGLTISAVAIYYSVVGLAAIFSAAVIPIYIMGSALEVAKLVCASWLKANWERAPALLKTYMSIAVVVLMLITSMGIFGFLSKAHNDQNLVSGDVQSKIAVYDEKIKTAKENIDANRKALKQMDEAVDQSMARSTTETGADKAVAIRRSQQKERQRLQAEIAAEQKTISKLSEERAPIAAEVRKVEAEVGPIKYIASFIYGDNPDANVLEKAVTWVIILIVIVFDPLAVIMLLAAQMTFAWHRGKDSLAEEDHLLHETVPLYVADVGEKPTQEEIAAYEKDDGPLTTDQIEQIKETANVPVDEQETALDQWNKMIEEAEAEAVKQADETAMQERIATGESYIDGEGKEVKLSPDFPQVDDIERPGDYLTPQEDISKKKTYMTKDEQGQTQVKSRS